jgi:hypothetical protein
MSEFDPIKALREEATGLVDVLAVLTRRENAAETAIGAAESELNAIRKLRGYAQIELARIRDRIAALEHENALATRITP